MVPRGAGAFLAAVDGNFSVWRSPDDVLEFGWARKLRGPGFVPVKIGGETYSHPALADADGIVSPPVRAGDHDLRRRDRALQQRPRL